MEFACKFFVLLCGVFVLWGEFGVEICGVKFVCEFWAEFAEFCVEFVCEFLLEFCVEF